MKKKSKILEHILTSSKNIRFSDLNKILIEYGYERRQSGTGGSHYVYSHPKVEILVVLVSHGKNDLIPEYQVKKAVQSIKKLMGLL